LIIIIIIFVPSVV